MFLSFQIRRMRTPWLLSWAWQRAAIVRITVVCAVRSLYFDKKLRVLFFERHQIHSIFSGSTENKLVPPIFDPSSGNCQVEKVHYHSNRPLPSSHRDSVVTDYPIKKVYTGHVVVVKGLSISIWILVILHHLRHLSIGKMPSLLEIRRTPLLSYHFTTLI